MSNLDVRILLIDDDEDEFFIVRDALKEIVGVRYTVHWAENARAAHELLQTANGAYDACLLDYNLGSITGLDFLKTVIGDYPLLPFILLTGFDDRAIDVEAMQSGVSDYLSKSQLEPLLLERTIRYAVERSRNLHKLQQYAEELQAKNRELDAYTHTIAHSLRSPLGLFTAFAGLIRLVDGDKLSPDSLELLDEIENHAMKLADMTSQLLLLAQVHDTAEVISEVEMQPVVAAAVRRFDHLIREHQITVDVPTNPPTVLGHAAWLEEVLANLISNAIKYIGADNQSATIKIDAFVKDNFAVYEVIDNGIGIAPNDEKRLFEMFSRIKSDATRHIDGTGLGLSVVRQLIEKMNGQVGVRSQLGKGSIFWFSLPTP